MGGTAQRDSRGNLKLTLESTNTTHQVLQPSFGVRRGEALVQHPSTVHFLTYYVYELKGKEGTGRH